MLAHRSRYSFRSHRTLVTAVLSGCLMLVAGAAPALAAWQGSSTRTAAVSMATFATTLTKVSGEGAVASGTYTLSGLLTPQSGYLKVANTSTAPAVVKLDYRMSSLVADTTISSCPQPWGSDGSCPGATVLADSRLLGNPTGTYTWPAPLAPQALLHLKVTTTGVTGGATLTSSAAPTRTTPADRTLG